MKPCFAPDTECPILVSQNAKKPRRPTEKSVSLRGYPLERVDITGGVKTGHFVSGSFKFFRVFSRLTHKTVNWDTRDHIINTVPQIFSAIKLCQNIRNTAKHIEKRGIL